MLKSLLLTISLSVFLFAVLSALGSLDSSEVDYPGRRVLPAEIMEAEAEYEVLQQAIDREIQRLTFGTLDLPAEQRRDAMLFGLETQRPVLADQQARSDAIDALYEQYQVPQELAPLEVLAGHTPKDTEASSPSEGRSWALDYDLARLRQDLAGEPEKLRAAMLQWNADNADALRALRESSTTIASSADQIIVAPMSASRLEESPEASDNLRELVSLQNDLAVLSAQYPPPVSDAHGDTAIQQEMETWRGTLNHASAPLLERISPLLHEFGQETNRRLARQYSDENTR